MTLALSVNARLVVARCGRKFLDSACGGGWFEDELLVVSCKTETPLLAWARAFGSLQIGNGPLACVRGAASFVFLITNLSFER